MELKAKILFSSAFFLWFIQEFYLLQTGGSHVFRTHYLPSVLLVLLLTLLLFLSFYLYWNLKAEKPAFLVLSLYFLLSSPLFWKDLNWLMTFDALLFVIAFLAFIMARGQDVGGWEVFRRNSAEIVLFLLKISVVFFFLYFLPGNLMGYDTGECPMFGTVVYNTPCRLYSLGMFFLGILVLSLLLAGKNRSSSVLSALYFTITFFGAWTWAVSARLLALAGIVLSVFLYLNRPHETGGSRPLVRALGLVLYTLAFLIFLLSAFSYVLYFSWICGEAYSGTLSSFCLASSYLLIGLGMASPFLWLKDLKVYAVLVLLPVLLFMKFVIRMLLFPELVFASTFALLLIELFEGGWVYERGS